MMKKQNKIYLVIGIVVVVLIAAIVIFSNQQSEEEVIKINLLSIKHIKRILFNNIVFSEPLFSIVIG